MGDNGAKVQKQSDEDKMNPTEEPFFVIHTKVNVLFVGLTFLTSVTRLWLLEEPRGVVFDEIHFGLFTGLYQQGTFFFDVHPPLGKLLLALMGYLAGYDGSFDFSSIGTEYPCHFPIWYLRVLPAICGSLLCPLSYLILSELGFSQYAALLAGFLVLTDNALLVQSRFILIDSFLLCSLLCLIFSLLKFCKNLKRPFNCQWVIWTLCLSVAITASLSIKYSGLFTLFTVSCVLLYYFWKLLTNRNIPLMKAVFHLLVYFTLLVLLPIFLYCAIFYTHLSILTKSGPHDERMSSQFQASLEGGLAKMMEGQPIEVAYGSQITLRHMHGTPCWLHSHPEPYPVRYSDNRGSSAQQQVTCYTYKDINNWWVVVDPNWESIEVENPPRKVKNGDIVKLIHGVTGRSLNSHDVAAPMSPQCMEVSCYIDYNISFPAQPLWQVELLNGKKTNNTWHAIESHLRLIHVTTDQALKFTGLQLPDWGFYQYEVATDRNHNQEPTVWNVEEHRLIQSDEYSQQLPPDLWTPGTLGFWEKFVELQFKMLSANKEVNQEHQYSSTPLEWPMMHRGIAYWINPASNAQIHFLGNPVIWVSGMAAVFIFSVLFVIFAVRWRRQCQDLNEDEWTRFLHTGVLLAGGWIANLVPYFLMERTLFLHHYLPALLHLILLIPATLEIIYYHVLRSSLQRNFMTSMLLVWMTSIVLVFIKLSPLSYGHTPLSQDDITTLQWRDSWGLIYHEEMGYT